MNTAIDTLEKNVVAAASLIASLRETVSRLTRELELSEAARARDDQTLRAASAPPDPSLMAELERLRAERVVIREQIRRLLKEIDRVSW